MTLKTYLLIATICVGVAAVVKALQIALTPDAWTLIAETGERLLASSGFGFLAAGTAIVALLTACVAGWHRSEQAYREQCEARREAIAILRAPCGEEIHTSTDRGPKAA